MHSHGRAGRHADAHPVPLAFVRRGWSGASQTSSVPQGVRSKVGFLRDFGYDVELLGRDEVDERQLVGLQGVVKISHIVFNGASLNRFDGFAPAGRWEELSPANLDSSQVA